MRVRVEKDRLEWRVHVRGISRALANTLRRCILRDVPTLGVTRVLIKTNSTNFWDEYVAHRVALMSFEGKPGTMTLQQTGTSQHPQPVTAANIIGDTAKVTIPDMPVVLLMDGQTIHMDVTMGYGTGRQHARFAPGVCYFNEQDEEIVLYLEPRDGLCGRDILVEGIRCVRKAIDAMKEYTVVAQARSAPPQFMPPRDELLAQ